MPLSPLLSPPRTTVNSLPGDLPFRFLRGLPSTSLYDKRIGGLMVHKTLIVLLPIVLLVVSLTAMADCVCRCVNGQMQAICTSTLDIPPICPPTICSIAPPSIQPIPTPRIPPIGTTRCAPQQVYNPYTGRYEWKEVCW